MSKEQFDKIVNHVKVQGFIYAGSEIYGGLANSWDYGPLGVEMKNNIKKAWLSIFFASLIFLHFFLGRSGSNGFYFSYE